MKNRETFATSGPRIKVRFFGELGKMPAPKDATSMAENGYAIGVPMGGMLKGPTTEAPSFTFWAIKEADGANIDRIQIVKGWVDAKGSRTIRYSTSFGRASGNLGERKAAAGR